MSVGADATLLVSLLVAVAAGLLVGIEREHRGQADPSFGGVRTFPLIALSGALAALTAPALGPWLLAAGLLATTVLLGLAHMKQAHPGGLTSEIAALVVYLLGALAGAQELGVATERYLLVLGGAAATMALLS